MIFCENFISVLIIVFGILWSIKWSINVIWALPLNHAVMMSGGRVFLPSWQKCGIRMS